jgi:hypothetical protein
MHAYPHTAMHMPAQILRWGSARTIWCFFLERFVCVVCLFVCNYIRSYMVIRHTPPTSGASAGARVSSRAATRQACASSMPIHVSPSYVACTPPSALCTSTDNAIKSSMAPWDSSSALSRTTSTLVHALAHKPSHRRRRAALKTHAVLHLYTSQTFVCKPDFLYALLYTVLYKSTHANFFVCQLVYFNVICTPNVFFVHQQPDIHTHNHTHNHQPHQIRRKARAACTCSLKIVVSGSSRTTTGMAWRS